MSNRNLWRNLPPARAGIIHLASALTWLALITHATPTLADDWLPPVDADMPEGTDTDTGSDAAEAGTDAAASPLRIWSDLFHDHGSTVRSSIAGISASLSKAVDAHWQVGASVDLDHSRTKPDTTGESRWRLGVRELYVRRTDDSWWMEAGRINVRNGVATGYNPSDFLRTNSIAFARTRDPQRLRESRLGAVQLRAGSRLHEMEWAVSVSPRISEPRDPAWHDPRWGAVNHGASQQSLEISLPRWQGVFSQLIWQHHGDAGNRFGASLNTAVGQSAILYAEWASIRRVPLMALANRDAATMDRVAQWATGFSYTTSSRITVGLEWQHNGAGLSRSDWQGDWQRLDPASQGRVVTDAAASSDPLSRHALMASMLWERFGHRNADLNCLWRRNQSDHSHMTWCEWRYKGEADEWSVAGTRLNGSSRSEFGMLDQRWSVALRWRHFW